MRPEVLQSKLFDAADMARPTGVCVIGVGDAGCRAASEVRARLHTGARVICIDTDSASLARSKADQTVLVGAASMHGFGSGGDQTLAEEALATRIEDIRGLVAGAECVLIVAGTGGGTGSAIAPIVASVAKKSGAMVISMAIMPFEFEGIGTHLQAADTFDRLRQASDAVLETPGSGSTGGDRTLTAAMEQDRRYVASFASVVTSVIDAGTGQSTLTAAHLGSILGNGALTTFGTGEGLGLTGAVEAAEACADSALSNRQSTGAINRAVLLIESGPELSISHIATAMATIEARIGAAVELQPGVRRSRLLTGKVRVSLVGTIQEVKRPLVHNSPGLLAGFATF